MSGRIVLGIDPGTQFGWGVLHEFGDGGWEVAEWGVETFTPQKGDAEGVRFRNVADFLPDLLKDVDAVGIENWTSRSMRASAIGNGIVALILVECERQGIEYAFIAPSSLKKHTVGHGGSKKNPVTKEMMRRSLDGFGPITPETEIAEDAADALCVARWLTTVIP